MPRCSVDVIEDLLRTTRETLMECVLPALDQEGRYTLRMAINAIQITERSLGADESQQMLIADLRALYCGDDAASAESPDALLRRFAADIRLGRFDSDQLEQRVRRLLRDDVERRLQISNPKYLSKTRVRI